MLVPHPDDPKRFFANVQGFGVWETEDGGQSWTPRNNGLRAAWPLGKAVLETEPRSKAAKEISQLQNWVFAQLQVCTPDNVQNAKVMSDG